jgi:hypothetical protein
MKKITIPVHTKKKMCLSFHIASFTHKKLEGDLVVQGDELEIRCGDKYAQVKIIDLVSQMMKNAVPFSELKK